MSINASSRQVDSVTIVDLSGRITLGEATSILREALQDLAGKGQKKILLNLADVNYIDSSGVASLVEAFQVAKRSGKTFALASVNPAARRVLELARLDKVFTIHATVADGLDGDG